MIKLSLVDSEFAVHSVVEAEFTLEQLTEALATHEVGPKEGEALIPAVFQDCPEGACRASNPDSRERCGGGQPHKLGANVTAVTMLGVDLDHLAEGQLNAHLRALAALRLRFWWWETHSHAPPLDCRARVLVPFAAPLEITNPRQWSQIAWPALIKHLGLDGVAGADPACKDPARVYYTPRKPDRHAVRKAGYVDGQPLDWKPLLEAAMAIAKQVPEVPVWQPAPADAVIDFEEMRAELRKVRRGLKATLVKRMLAGEALSPPPETRGDEDPTRYQAWLTLTALLGARFTTHPLGALVELVRASYASEVAEGNGEHTPWETVEGLLASAQQSAPQYEAQRKAERAARLEGARSAIQLAASRPRDNHQVSPVRDEVEEDEEPAPGPADDIWKLHPDFVRDPMSEPEDFEPKNCIENVELALREHPQWKGTLRFNELTQNVEVWGGPLGGEGRPLTDEDGVRTRDWFARQLGIGQHDGLVWARLLTVASLRSYNPVTEYLDSLEWDGVVRAADFPATYLNSPSIDDEGNDVTEYNRTVFCKWLVSCVARAYKPGCKVDTMIHLEGEQGKFKSTMLAILGGAWFTDASIDFGSKDSMQIISKAWIVEVAEGEALRKSEVTQQKAFLARTFDEFRPPYGRVNKRFPRRCVFASTTNADQYLKDVTGARRHWPVKVDRVDLEAMRRDRNQVWAEAVALYRSGLQWWLTDDEQVVANVQTEQRAAQDAITEQIEDWFARKAPEKRPHWLTSREICVDVLGEPVARGLELKIAEAMRRLKAKKGRFYRDGIQLRGYATPQRLLDAGTARGEGVERGLTVVPNPETVTK